MYDFMGFPRRAFTTAISKTEITRNDTHTKENTMGLDGGLHGIMY